MSKGSYGRKHKRWLEEYDNPEHLSYDDYLPPHRKKSPYEAELVEILLNPQNFDRKFLNLSDEKQLAMARLLRDTTKHAKNHQLTGFAADFARGAFIHLEKIFRMSHMHMETATFEKISEDEKRLIRMASYGGINRRQTHQLSQFYKFFTKAENKGKWRLRDYDIKKSPMWRAFMQFDNFRAITADVRKYMQRQRINPDALKVMTVNDFCDVIFNIYKTSVSDTTAIFSIDTDSAKTRFVKAVMKHCGKQYRQMLLEKGYSPEAVDSMCYAMEKFGITDPEKVTVTSFVYTKRIINDLMNAGYDVVDIKEGTPIPQEFLDYLLDKHQEKLLQARDENGNKITANELPRLEYHHLSAVKFAKLNGYLARTNYEGNGLLVESKWHNDFIHLFDDINKQIDNFEQFLQRLNADDKTICLMTGIGNGKQLYADLENTAEFKKREEEDKKYVVNYLDMEEERLNNEMEIAQKYNIGFSRIGVTHTLGKIKDLKKQPTVDAQKIKAYEKWLKEQNRGRRNKKQKDITAIINDKKGRGSK